MGSGSHFEFWVCNACHLDAPSEKESAQHDARALENEPKICTEEQQGGCNPDDKALERRDVGHRTRRHDTNVYLGIGTVKTNILGVGIVKANIQTAAAAAAKESKISFSFVRPPRGHVLLSERRRILCEIS